STLGIPEETLEKQIQEVKKQGEDEKALTALCRLISLKLNSKNQKSYSIHPRREFIEYFSCLYAILDDTDLLSKVSARDVDCVVGKPSHVFDDTKEQNGCCRVGQTKIFCKNYPYLSKYAPPLRAIWFNDAKKTFELKPQIDFHLHMISTITSADEVYKATPG